MADIEHINIVDPQIHEPKDVASANANTAYVANGLGSGSFQPITITGTNVTVDLAATSDDNTNQGPTVADTAHQVLFGPGGTEAGDVVINSNGTIDIFKTSTYLFIVSLTFGRNASVSAAQVSNRLLVNGTQLGFSASFWVADSNVRLTETSTFAIPLIAGDVITFEIIRDSAGTNDGGLFFDNITATGWVNAPSASISIYETLV